MVCDDTLRIKNLPKELSTSEKEEFLRHFGATQVKILTSNYKEKSTAYAKFSSKELAKSVMLRLHQVSILNSRLCIEFADQDLTENKISQKQIFPSETENRTHFKMFINRLTAWNSSVSFNQPPPPHLKYAYPNPNRATINNIAHALASVPKFYTQVLHLMNRMNLPPPFSDVPDPPQTGQRLNQLPQQPSKQKEESSESELESDNESTNIAEIIPKKRTLPQKKTVKRPKFIKPSVASQSAPKATTNKPEDVFDKVDIQAQKRIEVKVSTESLENKIVQNVEDVGSFGIMETTNKEEEKIVETLEDDETNRKTNTVISEEELNSNKIPDKDLSVLSVFKNYHPGAPTCRLYIKNIAKTANVKDLEFIYRRYIEDMDESRLSQFDVRLMQEGKMKGQAFITLDSVQLAQKALKETNGYILKDKPLVVVFARSAVPKK